MTTFPTDDGFRDAMLNGLTQRPRAIPCKYLYDAEGSDLFERITGLEEYYPTRTEIGLLERHGADIARMIGPGARVVEFGAGSMRKTGLLLEALNAPAAYVPIDVAQDMLMLAARRIADEHPGMVVSPMVADFLRPLDLPDEGDGPVLGFFPGSTIGNMVPGEACDFLRRVGRLVGPDGWLLVGVDLAKDPRILEAAYNDVQGVTSAFILNLLARANRELEADFDTAAFDHRAWWNARESRVEIHLCARRRQTVKVAGQAFAFDSGDLLHVENCYKYTVEQFGWLARQGGFQSEAVWTDPASLFSLHLLRRSG